MSRPDYGLYKLTQRIKPVLYVVHFERITILARVKKLGPINQRAVYLWAAFMNLIFLTYQFGSP